MSERTDRASFRKGYVAVDFVTAGHRISGEVRTAVNPLADMLNDSLHSLIEMENVYIASIDHPADITGHFLSGHLRKDSIFMAILRRAADGLPRRQTYGSPVAGDTEMVFLSLPGFEVRGQLSRAAALNPEELLLLASERFIVIADATAHVLAAPSVSFHGGIILVNRDHVGILCKSSR